MSDGIPQLGPYQCDVPRLRPYQTDCLERVRQRVREGKRRIVIQSATGAGKGTMAAHLMAQCFDKGKRAVFLANRRKLVDQMIPRLDQFRVKPGVIMRGYPKDPSRLIQLVSRDTLFSRAITNDWMELPDADLVIIEECHNSGGRHDVLLARYPDAVVLGLSATPIYSGGRGMGCPNGPYQAMEQTVPTSQLVKEGWLCPVRCFSPESDVKGKRKGRRRVSGCPVYWWKRLAEGRPTILFASKCEFAKKVCEQFNKNGVPAEYADAHTSDGDRDAILARLAAGFTKVVCGVNILAEGVDLPEVACIQLMRMAVSPVTYLQIVGRGLRPHHSKKDCIVIDMAGAVLRHGFPDEDFEWSLNPDEDFDSRLKKAKKDGKMKTAVRCPMCFCTFSGSLTCPSCGHVVPPKRAKDAPRDDENLIEVPREQREEMRRQQQFKDWSRFRAVAVNRGLKAAAASQMFKKEYGTYPETLGMPQCVMGAEWYRPASAVWPQFLGGGGRGW